MSRSGKGISKEVVEGIWLIEAPLNGRSVAFYLLHGFHPETVIIRVLRRLGFAPEDVGLILNTHGHPDRLGGNANLQRLTGGRICMCRFDVPMAAGAEAHIASATDHVTAMRNLDWDDEVESCKTFLQECVDACPVDRVLEAGDLVNLGASLALSVVATPGRSPGSILFHIRDRGLAIVGDVVRGWSVTRNVLPLFYDPEAYSESLDTIARLGVRTLCLGHDLHWPKSDPTSSPARSGSDVGHTLEVSRLFAAEPSRVWEATPRAAPSAERAASIARALRPPFRVTFDERGQFPATTAATILSELRMPLSARHLSGQGSPT